MTFSSRMWIKEAWKREVNLKVKSIKKGSRRSTTDDKDKQMQSEV